MEENSFVKDMTKQEPSNPKRWQNYSAENSPQAWLYLLPALIIIGVFNVFPLIRTFIMSMQTGKTLNSMHFGGFKNFEIILRDPKFHIAIFNTVTYAIVVVPVGLIISMLIATTIYTKIKNKTVFETIFFIPYLTSVIAIGIVFRYLFNGDYGFSATRCNIKSIA